MQPFLMPRVALDDDEQMVLSAWMTAEGDSIDEGEAVIEVETSKANMEVEAPVGGRLALRVKENGDVVSPGDLIGLIAENGEDYDGDALRAEYLTLPTAVDALPASADAPNAVPVPVPAAAPSLAVGARTTEAPAFSASAPADHAEWMQRADPRIESGFLVGALGLTRAVVAAAPSDASDDPGRSGTPRELSRHRLAVGRLMSASAAIPQFSVHLEVPTGNASELVLRLRSAGLPTTFTDVVLMAVARTLAAHPTFNSQLLGSTLYEFAQASIGLAVDSPGGVVAPVIRDVDLLSWAELAEQRSRVVDGARSGRILSENLTGGTFSISNVGPLGGDVIVPMLTPPQTAILGIARIRREQEKPSMTAVLVADHRVHDGADAARFLATLSTTLTEIDKLMLPAVERTAR